MEEREQSKDSFDTCEGKIEVTSKWVFVSVRIPLLWRDIMTVVMIFKENIKVCLAYTLRNLAYHVRKHGSMYASGRVVTESYILIGRKREQPWAWYDLLNPQNPTPSSN